MVQTNENSEVLAGASGRLTSRSLAKAIFDAPQPEQFIRTIPAQSLYLAVRTQGLDSSLDLLAIATSEQIRLLLDFDLWNKDEFSEDRFFEWLALSEEGHELDVLQKVLKSLDLKLLALLLSRYLDVITYEQNSDSPPQQGFYTPDKGNTWIHIKIADTTRHFVLARFLALLFETSPNFFYQVLSIPSVATPSQLEEESFEERCKRIEAEGVPSMERAQKLHAPLSLADLKTALALNTPAPIVQDIPVVEPLVFEPSSLEPFGSLLRATPEGFAEELTLLMNAAVVRYAIDIADTDRVTLMAQQVRGAINVGLEKALAVAPEHIPISCYECLRLQKLYRAGLTQILEARKIAKKVSEEQLKLLPQESEAFSIIGGLREPFPLLPNFFRADGTIEAVGGHLAGGFRAIETVAELKSAQRWVTERFPG